VSATRSMRVGLIAVLAVAWCIHSIAAYGADRLRDGFRNPPQSAKPYTWWHWMNGNVSADGIRKDLAWMKGAGFGGFQWFQVDLETPVVVDQRAAFDSPAWHDALHVAAAAADRLGLEMALATSPGWSAAGGPWVSSADAMQKLVWSSIDVVGGQRIRRELPALPAVAGPYQDMPVAAIETAPAPAEVAPFSVDFAVIAYRIASAADDASPVAVRTAAGAVDGTSLADGRFGELIDVPVDASGATAWVSYEFTRSRTVRAVTVGLPAPQGSGAPPPVPAHLEVSADGVVYERVAELPVTKSPVRTATFGPVEARYFRLVLDAVKTLGATPVLPTAPGALLPNFGAATPRYAISEWTLSAGGRVHHAAEKAGFGAAANYYGIDTPQVSDDFAIDPASIVDLTHRSSTEGMLDWTAPPGRWRIVRFGHSPTGEINGPAPADATGLEVDKLDGDKVERHLGRFYQIHHDAFVTLPDGHRGLVSDSIESGPKNWSPALPAAFRRLRGYDLRPWLPVLTGAVVGSAETSDRFLWDFRRTIAQLIAENYYGRIASFARAHGLTYYAEALEDRRPQLGDDLEMRRAADVPMGAMWWFEPGATPRATLVYGRPLVAAESLTSFGFPWAVPPRQFKSTVDLEFALGINRVIMHTSAHQPFDDRKPGFALAPFLGQYLTRHETRAEMATGFTDYLARSSFMLQQGRFAADIAYFYGEEGPVTGLYGDQAPAHLPDGHAFDFVGADAIARQLSVADGRLVSSGGTRYRVLYVGGSSRRMTNATLARLVDLVDAGAVPVGERPVASPSLAGDAQEFDRLADALWPADEPSPRRVGAGQVWNGRSLREVFAGLDVPPDWDFAADTDDDARLAVLHRRLEDGDLYFVSNRRSRAVSGRLTLRALGRTVEIWRADDATINPVTWKRVGKRTEIPLSLNSEDAVFIVLRGAPTASGADVAPARVTTLTKLASGWRVAFAESPHEEVPSALRSWHESTDPGLRYYSGTATYRNHIDVPADWMGNGRMVLDLGRVYEVASVSVNGRPAGVAWKPPYRLDVGDLLVPGRNVIEITVANLWVNRLIADAQPGAVAHAFTTVPAYRADAPLRPSGLIGPVRLLAKTQTGR
jgi:(4-O-methyl)-D-glucuronate---lignin esterase